MNRTILALLAVSAASFLASACHERRQDPPMNEDAIRAHSAEAHGELQRQTPPNPEAR